MNVSAKGISKRFASKNAPAVSDVSFTAVSGGITTLLGPSGSGKTTLLRILAGLETADLGQVFFDERDVTELAAQKRGIGFVFQNFALFNHMTVSENIAYALEIRGVAKAEQKKRVDELQALVQLEGLGERYPRQLSGGQRQRVGFARALAARPLVLLLDEPFGALDAQVRVELRAWLKEFHEQTPVTTILVTHDQDEALELSDHVVVLLDGKVAQAGPPHDVYDHPASPEVAAFLGGANVLRGRAFVRPHDVRLARPGELDGPEGRVRALRRIGGTIRLSVELPSGETVAVESPKNAIDQLGIREGDAVAVDLGAARVFAQTLDGLRAASSATTPRSVPRREDAAAILEKIATVLFPEYRANGASDNDQAATLRDLASRLSTLIASERHAECPSSIEVSRCEPCAQAADRMTMGLVACLPEIRRVLEEDLRAALAADPAAHSPAEVALCYPGFRAITAHRLTHVLWQAGAPLAARLLAEEAHTRTGVDLHPGAQIGPRFFIDHGTGVVVGETAVIGADVKLYQGVTLGGRLSEGAAPGSRRHPTLEDGVTVHANAAIVGPVVVGRGAVILGNAWITANVPSGVEAAGSSR